MFIQCQHCQTTYKIDEHKIPEKKSVVRCAKCSELIPLNREKQHELSKKSPKKIVECDACGTQYSVPLSSIKDEITKARCGKCGNFFNITKSGDYDYQENSSSAQAYEEDYNDDIGLDNIEIPEGSEIEVDDLFGNVNDSKKSRQPAVHGKLKTGSTTDAYLESIKLTKDDEQEAVDEDFGINEIAGEQKYKIFLKPKTEKRGAKTEKIEESWPDLEANSDFGKLEDDIDQDFKGIKSDKKVTKPPKKPVSPSKKKTPSEQPQRAKRRYLLWFIWLLVLVSLIAVAWIFMDVRTKEVYTTPQTETFDNQSKIAILEPLSGRFIKNTQIPERMFVLEGKLLNVYGADIAISKVEIEGYLYTQDNNQPNTAISFAGASLNEDQLKNLNKIDIESILMEQSQDTNALKEFGADDLIDFQVVFFNAPDPQKVFKLGAKIKKFNRRKL
jgi:predicted Zn finger-like uncharacterized protein